MYYQNSVEIFDKIKNSKKILINCHYNPDPDSVSSALSLYSLIKSLKIEVDIVCPNNKLPSKLSFLDGYNEIKLNIDYENFDFSPYDLVFLIDSANSKVVSGKSNTNFLEKIKKLIVIDHHATNNIKANIKLMDNDASSVTEIIYRFFEDNQLEIIPETATKLLTGIYGDTSLLTLPSATERTYDVVNKLVHLNADKNAVVMYLSKSEKLGMYKFWSFALSKIEVEVENRFAYIFIPFEEYSPFLNLENAKSKVASIFSNGIIDTDFGIVGVEKEKGVLDLSLRARTDYDTSVIAKALGGGGHRAMSAVLMEGIEFNSAIEKVLEVCRKYANKSH